MTCGAKHMNPLELHPCPSNMQLPKPLTPPLRCARFLNTARKTERMGGVPGSLGLLHVDLVELIDRIFLVECTEQPTSGGTKQKQLNGFNK